MTYEQILAETRGRVGIIRLNRPEKLNAWTATMEEELADQITRWNADEGIGAFVITGQGRAFCAGADLGGFGQRLQRIASGTEPVETRFASRWVHLMRRSKPSVVAFNGVAVGVGLTLALPCDVRIAAQGARLSIRFVRVGLVPELGSTRILPQIVGLAHATDMCLSGRFVEAEEAQGMGLVSAVVPAEELLDAAVARAAELADNPTAVVMLIKDLLARNPTEPDIDAVMEREQVRDRIARTWPAHAEAVRAFAEKRQPVFHRQT